MNQLFQLDWRELWDGRNELEGVGAVFTKPAVVDFILDLAGYTSESLALHERSVLEPSCGDGAFVQAVVQRLAAYVRDNSIDWFLKSLESSLVATDIDEASLSRAKESAVTLLTEAGCAKSRAHELSGHWFKHLDFLLEPWSEQFDFVVGNPPYVRIEELPSEVLLRYRKLYSAATDRADLYVAFIQRGLELLKPDGALAFICANRFVKNRYGAELRRIIAQQHRVRYYVNLEHTQPFVNEVSAYPAIFVVDNQREGITLAATIEKNLELTLPKLRDEAFGRQPLSLFQQFASWYRNGEPWISTSANRLLEIRELEDRLPLLEDSASNTRVGIGVATGADHVFVLASLREEIEPDRQIPLVMAGDVSNSSIRFSGHYLLNPFDPSDDGSLVDLNRFPGLAGYIERHKSSLLKRHVAKNRPSNWYRTIDRIWPEWQFMPKLLIPDIRSGAVIGIDQGNLYPHHNLYWIASSWPLGALKALLRSTFVHRQVEAFSVQMRGGALRFQAQTLRKLRIPSLSSLTDAMLDRLSEVSAISSQEELDGAVDEVVDKSIERLRLN